MSLSIVAGHVIDRPAKPLTDERAHRIAAGLADAGIHIEPIADVFGTWHLWQRHQHSVAQEVAALRAFLAEHDSPVHWHPDIVWVMA